jgi:hypothetical protein
VWLRPLAQTIEHVVSMQKCSFNHAIPVFRRRQEHVRHEGLPSQAVKKACRGGAEHASTITSLHREQAQLEGWLHRQTSTEKGCERPNRVLTEGSRRVAAAQGEFEAATAWCSAGSPLVVVVRHSVKGM